VEFKYQVLNTGGINRQKGTKREKRKGKKRGINKQYS